MEVAVILKEIEKIVSPEECKDASLLEVFRRKTESVSQTHELCMLEPYATNEALRFDTYPTDCHWWNFIRLLLAKLVKLAHRLNSATEEKETLLNVTQQKHLKTAFEIVVSLGLAQHFPPGVGHNLSERSTQWAYKTDGQPLTIEQKVTCLGFVLKCCVELRQCPTLRGIIVSNYLGDLLAATFALQLYGCRSFGDEAKDLFENTFQPFVLKELMLLLHNKKCSSRLKRGLGKILSNRISVDGGVVAFIRAVLDLAPGPGSPSHWQIVSVLSKVLVHPHTSEPEVFRAKVFSQLLCLIHRSDAAEYMQVAVAAVSTLHETDPQMCRTYFTDPLENVLIKGGDEHSVENSIVGLRNLCALPSCEHWSLPPIALSSPARVTIYALYCKTIGSVCSLKSPLKDLMSSFVVNCDGDAVLKEFLFGEPNVNFVFGDEGGVKIACSKDEEPDWEFRVDALLQLLEQPGLNMSKVVNSLFNAALGIVAGTNITGEKLLCTKLLSELSSHQLVHEGISKDPSAIVNFVKALLKDINSSEEFACLGLMVVAAILDDPTYRHSRDWALFQQLVAPLEEFKNKCSNLELRVLAEDIRGNILTRGIVSNSSSKSTDVPLNPKTSVSDAIKEATDSFLPVRAHGLRSLGHLVRSKHPEAELKKDVIFCLFKENLKEDDSYVYLSAVEGMANMAVTFPDETLDILREQFIHAKNSETRLKVGEILMKVVRLLGEMACVYKKELIHAMLVGCRDSDHLVRASSLSNLGELLQVLSFRAHAYLVEILDCLTRIYETDKEQEPRRAAVMALALLLKGFGIDTFTTLQDSVVQLRRALTRLAREDNDDITKLHAHLALEQLSAATIAFINAPQRFEKRIFVLDPPM